jgi:hypothetical protein
MAPSQKTMPSIAPFPPFLYALALVNFPRNRYIIHKYMSIGVADQMDLFAVGSNTPPLGAVIIGNAYKKW